MARSVYETRAKLIECADLFWLMARLRARQSAGHPDLALAAANAMILAADIYSRVGMTRMKRVVVRYGNWALKAWLSYGMAPSGF